MLHSLGWAKDFRAFAFGNIWRQSPFPAAYSGRSHYGDRPDAIRFAAAEALGELRPIMLIPPPATED
jgi:hypothetical protein